MPKRPNQIIPVALFHSTSTGDLVNVTLDQCGQVQTLPNFDLPDFSGTSKCTVCNFGFKAYHGEREWNVDDQTAEYFNAMRFTQWFNLSIFKALMPLLTHSRKKALILDRTPRKRTHNVSP